MSLQLGQDGRYTEESLLGTFGDPTFLTFRMLMREFGEDADVVMEEFLNKKFPPSWWVSVRSCLPQQELNYLYAERLLKRFEGAILKLVEAINR